jgi:hypothetical protein
VVQNCDTCYHESCGCCASSSAIWNQLSGKTLLNKFSFEIFHIPAGCGVWPAIWLSQDSHQTLPNGTQEKWHNSGEIDIIEQVNNNTNSTTLHLKQPQNPQCVPKFNVPLAPGSYKTCSASGSNTGC